MLRGLTDKKQVWNPGSSNPAFFLFSGFFHTQLSSSLFLILPSLSLKPWDHLEDCMTKKVPVSLDCIDDYSFRTEETTEYCVGWNQQPCPNIDQLRVTAGSWYFHRAVDIWGIPIAGEYATYGGGGYITNLDINLMVST